MATTAIPTDEVSISELEELTELFERLHAEAEDFLRTPYYCLNLPSEGVREAWISIYCWIADRLDRPWPRQTYQFLDFIEQVSSELNHRTIHVLNVWFGSEWRPAMTQGRPQALIEYSQKFGTPAPLPTPRQQSLETIEELDASNVSDQQIAIIYDWYDVQTGMPDVRRVREAREGAEVPPTSVELPGYADGLPLKQSSLDQTRKLCMSLPAEAEDE